MTKEELQSHPDVRWNRHLDCPIYESKDARIRLWGTLSRAPHLFVRISDDVNISCQLSIYGIGTISSPWGDITIRIKPESIVLKVKGHDDITINEDLSGAMAVISHTLQKKENLQ